MNKLVLGIDEVGRGAWAGPLVVGAVALYQDSLIDGLDDSKKLTSRRRKQLTRQIQREAAAIGIGWVDAHIIDTVGLPVALRLATKRAFAQIPAKIRSQIDSIIIDGRDRFIEDPRVTALIQADSKIKAVSAASIVAKVARDSYMSSLGLVLPEYNFAAHVGYGTASHSMALNSHGIVDGVHRQSFAPIAKIAGVYPSTPIDRITKTIGRRAEESAVEYLIRQNHTIIDRNWRTKMCEIDIVSSNGKILYFTEVKYRVSSEHGDGLAAITPRKLHQMRRAAEMYLVSHSKFRKFDVKLSALALSKTPPVVENYIDVIL